MSHSHNHTTDDLTKSSNGIKTAFYLNLIFSIAEFIGGFLTNSVSILSDALHDLGDSISIGLAWYLEKKSKQPPTDKFSFGYRRFSVLGAFINSVILIIGSIFVINEAFERIFHPEQINTKGMLLFAILGIIVNGIAVLKMKSGSSINEKMVTWHLIEDVLGWIVVLIVSIVLLFYPIFIIDAILSILITIYILFNVVKRLKETLYIFLQGVPNDINIDIIEREIQDIENIKYLKHLHIWTMDGEKHVFSAHVHLKELANINQLIKIKSDIRTILTKYKFDHYTIETEFEEEYCPLCESHFCVDRC